MKITTKYNEGLLERIEADSDITWTGGEKPVKGKLTLLFDIERLTLRDSYLYYSDELMPEPGYVVVDNDEFVRQCARFAPKKEARGWECENVAFLLGQIEARSDVVWWGTRDQPTRHGKAA